MLIEREEELAGIARALGEARAGRGAVVLIEGPAGIGKTALLEAAIERAVQAGFAVHRAQGGVLERDLPFGLVRTLLAGAVTGAAAAGGQGRARVGVTALSSQPGNGPTELHAVIDGIHWFVRDLATAQPVLLAVDDVHWGDAESLRLLAYLSRRLDGVRAVLVVAARAGEAGAAQAALIELASAECCVVLRPQPLSPAASAALLRTERDADADLCAEIHRASGGNPLYLRALARADPNPGLAGFDSRRDPASEIIGRSVFGRMAFEPPGAMELARAVAVLGTEVELAEAAALAELELDVAAEFADRLQALDILRAGTRLAFVHPVVRIVIYEGFGSAQRGVAHLAAAKLLSDAGAPAERVAVQVLQAPRTGEPWVVEALRRAAGEAAARAGHSHAVTYLQRAAAEAGDGERSDVLAELATAEFRAGRPEAIAHLAEAIEGLAGCARADRDLQLAAYLVASEREREAVEVLDGALSHASNDQAARIAAHAAMIALAGVPGQAAARGATLEGLSSTRAGAGPPLSTALAIHRFARCDRTLIDQLEAEMRAVLDGRVRSLELWFYAAWALMGSGRHEVVIDFARLVRERTIARGTLTGLAMASSALAAASLREGDVLAAEEHGQAALAAARQGVSRQYVPLACGATLAALTELDASTAELQPVLDLVDGATRTLPHAYPLWARARRRLSTADVSGAIADLRACGDCCLPAGITDPGWIPWRSDLALALKRSAVADMEPEALVEDELRLAENAGDSRAFGIALRAQGLLSGDVEVLHAAVETLAATTSRLEHARAQIDLGAALRRRRHRRLCRPPLQEALDTTLRLGARSLAAQARQELAAAGSRPRNPYRRGVHSLTASERRVARLAVEGRSNREIAEELYISMKTVESHLGSVYGKLQIGGREQLAEALRQHPAP